MLHGVLIVNLEPSYIGFKQSDSPCLWRSCSQDEIKELLIELGLEVENRWPLQEFIMRLPGEFSLSTLKRHFLMPESAA